MTEVDSGQVLDGGDGDSRKRKREDQSDGGLDEEVEEAKEPKVKKRKGRECPYLDTINRTLLDFDFEKVCSVSLSNQNVYACLVCGKYFQGRGRSSHAHFHSLQAGHHLFINLATMKIYCLPEDYEVIDSSLDDIKFMLNPSYASEDVKKIDQISTFTRCLDGSEYLTGVMGLNNIKLNDSINCCIQTLAHIPPIRNFFLLSSNYAKCKSLLVQRFGDLVKKLWNPKAFRAHVSPHELLQSISESSSRRFRVGLQSDPIDFLSWFLNSLHHDLGGTKNTNSSIIYQALQGQVQITTEKKSIEKEEVTQTPFLYLTVDIPPSPLFKSAQEANVIPQVPLPVCLAKFDGQSVHYTPTGDRKRYIIKKLPDFLIFTLEEIPKE